ncbi:MAG: acyltransferase [Sphingobacteriales bacterium]|nr:MAG: acyltransferase [Sphingobacteriales bacterium]
MNYVILWKEFKSIGANPSIANPFYLKGGKYITIGANFDCDQRLRLDAYDYFLGERFSPCIEIGDNVSIQKDCHIGAINKISIGNNVLLASKVFISDHSHGDISKDAIQLAPSRRKLYSKGTVIIEDNVWIGANASILAGVVIGKGAIIGANSVVTRDIPDFAIAFGNPARVIRYRA